MLTNPYNYYVLMVHTRVHKHVVKIHSHNYEKTKSLMFPIHNIGFGSVASSGRLRMGYCLCKQHGLAYNYTLTAKASSASDKLRNQN